MCDGKRYIPAADRQRSIQHNFTEPRYLCRLDYLLAELPRIVRFNVRTGLAICYLLGQSTEGTGIRATDMDANCERLRQCRMKVFQTRAKYS